MNFSLFWKLGLTSLLTFGLSACSKSVSGSEDEDEDSAYVLSPSSSSERGSGSVLSSSATKLPASCDTVMAALSTPSNLSSVKNGDNRWILFWNYERNDARPESAFIIEVLDMAASQPSWSVLDSTNADVTMFNLVGESKAGLYYRISAKDKCGTSKTTDMVQVSKTGSSTTTSAELAVPTGLKLDSLSDNFWLLSWDYKNNENRPEDGFSLQVLDLSEASPKWVDETSTNKGVQVKKIDGNVKGGLIYRVAAKDADGLSEYSAEIRIPNAPDSTTLIVDEELALAAPVNMKLDSMGDNKWKLHWDYTVNPKRPEDGFIVETLNLEASAVQWTASITTKQSVHYVLIDAKNYGGQYVRVAAKDSKGKSLYSSELMIPEAVSNPAVISGEELSVPFSLKLDTLGDNKWRVSWNYTNNKKRPENGFVIQRLDPAHPQWKDYDTASPGVHLIQVDASVEVEGSKLGGQFLRVAAKDGNDTSESRSDYSEEIMVPKYTDNSGVSNKDNVLLSVPTGLRIDSVGENKWRLSWSYTNASTRPENGFVLENLDLEASNADWNELGTTNKGVRYFVIDNSSKTYSKNFVHVAAKDDDGKSEFSTEVQIPDWRDYTSATQEPDAKLAVPSGLKIVGVGENMWKLTWNYTATTGRPETGFRVETFDLDAGTAWAAVNKSIPKGVHDYIFEVTNSDPSRLIHVVALDGDAVSDYSEGVQIPAYVDYNAPAPVVEMSVPTGLKLDSIGVGKFQLTWSYEDKKERPENGFVLQSMKPGDDAWSDAGTTGKGVHVFVIDAMANNKENSGKFYRVAAVDAANKLSDFSADIQVPLMTDDGTFYTSTDNTPLAVPTDLTLEDLGGNKWRIAWSYENNPSRPETKGFVLQKLNPKDPMPAWQSDAGQTNKGVHFFDVTLDASENVNEVFYRVAAKDSRGLSEYSATITLPKYSQNAPADGCSGGFAVPSNLKAERIAPSVWRLVWNYTQNTKCLEEKFVIQKVDVQEGNNGEWELLATTQRNVHYLNLIGSDNLNYYYRVAAVRGDDTTIFSNEVLLTRSTAYSSDVPFKMPSIRTNITRYTDGSGFDFIIIIDGNYPNHAMLNSEYTDEFQYQFRWNGDDETVWNQQTVTVSKQGDFQTTYLKHFNDINEFCDSYASARTVWVQSDGTKDYTEWTNPVGWLYGNIATTFEVEENGNKVSKDVCK